MATTKNLSLDQGSSFSYSLTATDNTGTALSITAGSGYTASARMRRSYYSSSYVAFTASITGATGNITITLGPTASAALKPGRYVYDVELECPNGSVYRQKQGVVTVDPEATK